MENLLSISPKNGHWEHFKLKHAQTMNQFYWVLSFFIFLTSCNGQNILPLPKDSTIIPSTQTKKSDINKDVSYGPGDIVQCAMQDKAGNLWFGTTGGEGVFRYDGTTFTNYSEKDGLCNNEVGVILEDKDGYIWFGTNDGACFFDGK
jgi:sugar lactone lactonase YvrE